MSQKLPVDSFELKKNMCKFNENFIKDYDEDSDKGYILEVVVKYPKNLFNSHSDLLFLPKEWRLQNVISLYAVCTMKTIMSRT